MTEQAKIALVTGASRGIGRAIAVGMAKRGFDIAINDIERQKDAMQDVAKEIEASGRRVLTVYADVSNKTDVETMVQKTVENFGRIDAVVNNAGILIASDVEHLKEEHWDSVLDVNAKGTFLVVQAVLPFMKKQNYGRIVNIASIGGKHGAPEQAHYSASKAAVMGFTRVLAQEVGTFGITANCICPGIILTDMGRVNLDDIAVRETWQEKTAMRRIGDPEDVVGPVAFLASDDAAFVTGQSLNVDGGIVLS
ncbi:SDR family NAD(P)-dependent oxidoreductase [Brucella pseudogrignonensis]|uniref:SDR family oxidoreductase n=1 Tax=Brucella pseudogrignonensis TaxID=419475 RepID=A0A7Y3WW75_9HYPH|nr:MULTISPECIES: SDR family NAD(P)-dependent oxidoreductase [Brucella]EMG52186.1 short-chain dehydrogenase/reductase SDR [Ochrobactrum sp. CDB2]MCM0752247.1 SDR family NAD(P)-dependent oxidoreductase [Brucella pseudogrignonensis]NNV19992.1 SDR family oxidoreductase [Brucella pseudogrignonensis]